MFAVGKDLPHQCPEFWYVHFFIAVLGSGLTSNFETVRVEIVDCPDLTKEPFTLACKGENCW
jgi:hypothetical protein